MHVFMYLLFKVFSPSDRYVQNILLCEFCVTKVKEEKYIVILVKRVRNIGFIKVVNWPNLRKLFLHEE
jgi:hypothetical protein